MPPHKTSETQLGWKAFFTLLALLQAVGVVGLFRVLDTVQRVDTQVNRVMVRQDDVILPTIARLEEQVEDLRVQ